MKKPIIVVGAGGHCRSVLDLIDETNGFDVIGLVEDFLEIGTQVGEYEILGRVADIAEIAQSRNCKHVVVAIGDNFVRSQISSQIRDACVTLKFPALVHPSAVISRSAFVGDGSVVFAGAVVSTNVIVKEGSVVNTGSTIDHDCRLGRYASLAPGVTLGGGVEMGDRSFAGIGATIIHAISIGSDTFIGGGSFVDRDLPSGILAYGSPCRKVRDKEDNESFL